MTLLPPDPVVCSAGNGANFGSRPAIMGRKNGADFGALGGCFGLFRNYNGVELQNYRPIAISFFTTIHTSFYNSLLKTFQNERRSNMTRNCTLITSRLSKFCHRELGNKESVTSSSDICSGDLNAADGSDSSSTSMPSTCASEMEVSENTIMKFNEFSLICS